ncbi:MAG TPA: PQQ-dependent sugar dehydrogenase, partial [Stellaceae bacterium]|nr:PQQ-dependent sugar dehydrogenase [Stellaceae bacterium]
MRRIVAAALSAAALILFAVLPSRAQPATVTTRNGAVAVERVAGGLAHPWGMAFLPDGRLLVTERPGRLRILGPDGSLSEPLAGVPQVFAQGQGGLLDVARARLGERQINQAVLAEIRVEGDVE